MVNRNSHTSATEGPKGTREPGWLESRVPGFWPHPPPPKVEAQHKLATDGDVQAAQSRFGLRKGEAYSEPL